MLAIILCTQACGYRFTTGTGHLPAGGTSVVIPVVDNRTPEVDAGTAFTAALRDAAWRAGLSVEGQGPHLEGTIVSIVAVPRGVALSADGKFRTREQEVVVEVRLTLIQSGQAPWEQTLVERVSYLSGTDLRDSEANRVVALRSALRRLADRGIDALTRAF